MLLFESNSQVVTNTPFLPVGNSADARSAALSNAVVALDNDINALFFNPATLYTSEKRDLSFTFLKNISDINSGSAVYSNDELINTGGVWAVSSNFTDFGSFEYANQFGLRNGGTFGAQNFNIGISHSNELDSNLYWGGTVRYLYAGLEQNSSSAMVVDAGLLYEFSDNRSIVGLSLLNAGFVLNTFDGADESITPDLRVGFSHRLQGMPLLFNIALYRLLDQQESFWTRFGNIAVGGEFEIGDYIRLRGGYDFYTSSNLSAESQSTFSGFSFGAGGEFKDFDINLSINQYGSEVLFGRISLNMDI
ncbi:MAG: hypothetical protein Kapaf2KO_14160 [Candidatus Kapaibacteriales bacterium]